MRAGNQRLVRLHHDVRLAACNDPAYNYDLVDGAGDGRPVLRRLPCSGAVRVGVGDAWSHSTSRRRSRDAGNRLQQPTLL